MRDALHRAVDRLRETRIGQVVFGDVPLTREQLETRVDRADAMIRLEGNSDFRVFKAEVTEQMQVLTSDLVHSMEDKDFLGTKGIARRQYLRAVEHILVTRPAMIIKQGLAAEKRINDLEKAGKEKPKSPVVVRG